MKNLAYLLAVCILVPLGCGQKKLSENKQEEKPNIILIISDDAGYADFGFNGSQEMHTPFLDQLAKEGVVFNQGYVSASVCCPSRMGLMTGRYQQRFGAECNVPTIPTPGFTETDLGMDLAEKTMGDLLRAQNYKTFMVGKWHLGENKKYHPLHRGFDEFYGFLGGSRSYWPLENPIEGHKIYQNKEVLEEAQAVSYLTDDFTQASIDFIERNSDQPFFIYLSYNAVHTPMHAKEEDIEQQSHLEPHKRKIYGAMTQSMDDNIGRLLAHLKKKGLDENTLIAFVNDNGGPGGNASKNTPLRGRKGSYWEGGIRVPFLLRWPNGIKPSNTRFRYPVSTLDLLPTFLAAAGVVQTKSNLDGKNLLPFLSEEPKEAIHDFLFWRMWRAAAVRKGDWKLIRIAEDPLVANKKLLAPLILLNLKDDPAEEVNLAEKHPEIRDELLMALENWEKGLSQPRWYDGKDWPHWANMQIKNHQLN